MGLAREYRAFLWFCASFSGAAIIVFPTNFAYHYSPVQAIAIFGGSFPLFGALFLLWAITIMVLGVTSEDRTDREHLLLVAMFIAVVVNFWTFRTNMVIPKEDGTYNLAYITEFVARGHLTNGLDSFYSLWPAIQIMVVELVEVVHLNITLAMALVVSIAAEMTGIFSYKLYKSALGAAREGFLALVLLYTGGVINQSSVFTPSVLGLMMESLLFWLVIRFLRSERRVFSTPVAMLLIFALGFTNLISLFSLSSAFLALIVLKGWTKRRSVGIYLLSLMFVMLFIPELTSRTYLGQITESLLTFLSKGFTSSFASTYTTKVGGPIPVWVSLLTLMWQVAFIVPVLLAPLIVISHRRGSESSKLLAKAAIGLFLFTGIFFLAGGGTSLIPLTFIPVLTAPLIVSIALGSSRVPKRLSYRHFLVAGVLCLLILPTFLAYNRNQVIYTYHEDDSSGFSFLQAAEPSGLSNIYVPYSNQLPYYSTIAPITFDPGSIPTDSKLWQTWDQMLAQFSSTHGSIFLFSPRETIPWSTLLDIPASSGNWTQILSALSSNNLVYGNGDVQIFES